MGRVVDPEGLILIHTKREARDKPQEGGFIGDSILIHTKREARDVQLGSSLCLCKDFNPHEARSS